MRKRTMWFGLVVIVALFISSCAALNNIDDYVNDLFNNNNGQASPEQPVEVQEEARQVDEGEAVELQATPAQPVVIDSEMLNSFEDALIEIYEGVSPSVVSIVAITPAGGSQGSGFVWDLEGHIVTNNHVVAGATIIQVEFYDGTIVDAVLVGSDAYSDLAVLDVNVSADFLLPVRMADSSEVRVGQLAIAIGNPFALENTMTTGIVSAIGRSIPAAQSTFGEPSYSIPDIIQTDAPINPGNSGGVLVNDQGEVIGVTAAIRSPSQANAGIGFAIPSNIVQRVVPVLIDEGEFQHPYIGVSGTRLNPTLAEAMGLERGQRGAVVMAVTEAGPAAKAGLRGSERTTTIDGQQVPVGGDVIIAIEDQPINSMDELIAYLFSRTEVGQTVTLTILRNGEDREVEVTLEARPGITQGQPSQQPQPVGGVYLGITGFPVTPELAQILDIPENVSGVLVEEVQPGSPADEAGIRGGINEVQIQGQTFMAGGDIITAIEDHPVSSVQELTVFLSMASPGDKVKLTILRDSEEMDVTVTLQARPTN